MLNDNTKKSQSADNIFVCLESSFNTINFNNINNDDIKKGIVFPFDEGLGIINIPDGGTIYIKMPNDEPFSYDIDIRQTISRKDGNNTPVNEITISDFPQNAIINVNIDTGALIDGTTDEYSIPHGYYRIANCNTIKFTSVEKPEQWIVEHMTEIVLSAISVLFAFILNLTRKEE